MADGAARESDEPRRGPFDDTVPASEPPEDIAAPRPPPAPERYRLGAELGRGGMGRVVEAFDTQLGRTVALKEVLPKGAASGTARRFAREVQLTARLEHPSIVPLYDSGMTVDGRPFYVMRRVSGRPFDELVARARGLDERITLLPALLAAIDAVAHAHRRNVIHRDIKPANILVGDLGETVVIDWGLAKVIGEEDESFDSSQPPEAGDSLQTQIGSVFGTPGFMAPEQARGEELGPRGDVYALGATLYQLLAGTPPVSGVSATEVIDKTARHEVRPLIDLAPGAPAELVAIVDKALGFDPRERYPNAGALGEDVRRFLAGQLVAAHRYTRWQRIARLAKRHRAPLGVAALAMVALAVLAWIGVHRIVTERDAADEARRSAVADKRSAEVARDALADRHDALVVTQARALLETNPTEAAATLKQLSAKSPRLGEGRAIAQAASVRGVAWALQSTQELTLVAELDATARRLVQVSRDGMVRVWDVDRRRLVLARPYARDSRALWVADGKLLVTHHKSPPQLLDPVANASEPLAIDPIVYAVATERGDRVVFTTEAKGVRLLDLSAGKREVKVWLADQKIDDLAIAPDGSWIAAGWKDALVVLDAAGTELTRRAGKTSRVAGSAHRTIAVQDGDKMFECQLDPKPVWTEIALGALPPPGVFDFVYRGRELDMYVTSGMVMAWNGTRVFQRMAIDRVTFRMVVAGGGTLIVNSTDGKLHFTNGIASGGFALPSAAPRLKLATRPTSTRVIAVGDGLIMGFDLAPMMPRQLPVKTGTQAIWVDDDTLLLSRNIAEWQWFDVATARATPIDYIPRGLPMVWDIDVLGGRVLVREMGPASRVLMLHKHTRSARVVAEGRDAWARLIPGDAAVFGTGDGRLFAQIASDPPTVVAKLEGVVENAVPLGPRRFAAHSTTGELVRGDLAGGSLERTRVPVGADGFLAADAGGRIVVVEDNRLLVWDTTVTEVTRFDKPISRVDPVVGGVAVHLSDNDVQFLELAPGAKPHRVLTPGKRFAATSGDGKLMAGVGNAPSLTLLEVPARVRWTLPALYPPGDVLALSPTTRKLVQTADFELAIWQLPAVTDDLGAWLDEQTNAAVDADGVLAWPWQLP